MVLEVYEQRERELNNYFNLISKQYERASQFYKDVGKFEDWYPEIENALKDEEELDNDPQNLKTVLAEYEACSSVFNLIFNRPYRHVLYQTVFAIY